MEHSKARVLMLALCTVLASCQPATLLVGVFTMAGKLEQRLILRTLYAKMGSPQVKYSFVVGQPSHPHYLALLQLEMEAYGDIILLDCEENMNDGKTLVFFQYVAVKYPDFAYTMKTDDDSFLHVPNLLRALEKLPRSDLLYGFSIPESDCCFMGGEGYVLSQDLVRWIGQTPLEPVLPWLGEDALTAHWLKTRGKAGNYVSEKNLFYDHLAAGGDWAHDYTPDTILIHQVKTNSLWLHVIENFFPATSFAGVT